MVLEERQDLADRARFVVMPFVDTRRSLQSAKSESLVVLTSMELRYRCRPCRKNGSCFWIVISKGPNRYVDESWQDQEDLPRDVGSTAFEQPHAITSSIEETHKPSGGREDGPIGFWWGSGRKSMFAFSTAQQCFSFVGS